MADILRPTVNNLVREHAKNLGIENPKLAVTEASKNGDSYSGEVYRIIVTADDQDLLDQQSKNG